MVFIQSKWPNQQYQPAKPVDFIIRKDSAIKHKNVLRCPNAPKMSNGDSWAFSCIHVNFLAWILLLSIAENDIAV